MEITEKDLEDLIFDGVMNLPGTLAHRGFDLSILRVAPPNRVYWQRQVVLGGYGRADIIGYTRCRGCLYVDIIELKNVPIVSQDFNQLGRYKTAVLEIIRNSFKGDFYPQVNTYLIGPEIQDGHYIQNNFYCRVFTFSYSIAGVRFEEHRGGWRNGEGNLHFRTINRENAASTIYDWPKEDDFPVENEQE